MKRLMICIVLLAPGFAGCQSQTTLLYANPPVDGAKQAQQCAHIMFGLGHNVDLSGNEAIRSGGIAKVKSVEYRMTSFHGFGRECVVAQGE
jgi:hypothetical protein